MPSLLKSPTTTATGELPTGNGPDGDDVNVPNPLPRSTVPVLSPSFAIAISCLLSPLKSPTARATGPLPTVNGLPGAGVNTPELLPSITVTVAFDTLTVAKSANPSPLKSPAAMPSGRLPPANGLFEAAARRPDACA